MSTSRKKSHQAIPRLADVSWEAFRERMLTYAALPRDRRTDLLFRGHSNAKWHIQSTLDRKMKFRDDESRTQTIKRLLNEFRRELIALAQDERVIPEDEALDLLGRHHGLPSQLLDWTQSPWIAAYFAFQDEMQGAEHVTIWRLDRAWVTQFTSEDVDLIEEPNLLRFNRRALMQRSVFLKVNTAARPLEKLLAPALMQYRIPIEDRLLALADLDEMGLYATRLFADVEGAAKTAWSRFHLESKDDGN